MDWLNISLPLVPVPFISSKPYLDEHDVIVEWSVVIVVDEYPGDVEYLLKTLFFPQIVFTQHHRHHRTPVENVEAVIQPHIGDRSTTHGTRVMVGTQDDLQ